MVWLFQTRHADSVSKPRSFRSATAARRSAQAGQAARLRTMQSRSPAMAQRLLRNTRTVHLLHSPRTTKTPPMRKPATGEPYAGEPHVRFGGRGGQKAFPTPIKQRVVRALVTFEELADFPHYDGVMVSFTAATNWLSVKGLGRN